MSVNYDIITHTLTEFTCSMPFIEVLPDMHGDYAIMIMATMTMIMA